MYACTMCGALTLWKGRDLRGLWLVSQDNNISNFKSHLGSKFRFDNVSEAALGYVRRGVRGLVVQVMDQQTVQGDVFHHMEGGAVCGAVCGAAVNSVL